MWNNKDIRIFYLLAPVLFEDVALKENLAKWASRSFSFLNVFLLCMLAQLETSVTTLPLVRSLIPTLVSVNLREVLIMLVSF